MSALGRWWSPYRITFTFAQITFLLQNIRELREGIYPPNPDGNSSYTDPSIINKSSEYTAYTENIGTVIGTLERWLLKTGIDGAMAYLRYTAQLSYDEIAWLFHINPYEGRRRVERAIRRCVYMGEKMRRKEENLTGVNVGT